MALLRLPAVAIALASLMPLLAHAAPAPSAEQAVALQQQVQKWLADASGGFFKVAPDTVVFTPEGDHYVVTVPLRKIGAVEPPDAVFTAKARMIDDTRWEIDDQKLPPSFRVTIDQPVPDAPDPKHPGAFKTHSEKVTYVVTIGDQASHATFDPTYATPHHPRRPSPHSTSTRREARCRRASIGIVTSRKIACARPCRGGSTFCPTRWSTGSRRQPQPSMAARCGPLRAGCM